MKYHYLFIFCIFLFLSCQRADLITEKEGIVPLNDTELYVHKIGNGDPIIVIHGGPGLSHDYLFSHISPLSKNFTLVFYDQRACGRSTSNVDSSEMRMHHFIEDIDALREYYEMDKVTLMAHSWGGLLAMKYALNFPDKMASLILVSSVGANNTLDNEANTLLAQRFSGEDNQRRMEIFQSDAFKRRDVESIDELMKLGFKYQFYNSMNASSLNLNLPEDYGARSQLLSGLFTDLNAYDFYDDLSKINVPTLLIYGEYDLLSEKVAPKLHESIPKSQLSMLSECGHFPFMEQSERFNELILEFLK